MPKRNGETITEFGLIRWGDSFYQALGGGPSVYYLQFTLPGRDARLVLRRYPPNSSTPWTVADVYVCDPNTGKFESTPNGGFTPNVSLVEGFNYRLNLSLPSVDYLFETRNGCCCHYARDSKKWKRLTLTPDLKVCDAEEHFVYRGADFAGRLWKPKRPEAKRKIKSLVI